MRRTSFCVLELFLLNTLLYFGHAKEANRAVVTIQPNWPKIYTKETIALRCEIKNGGDTEWKYEWRTTSLIKPPNENEYRISATVDHSGSYKCAGRNKIKQQFSTGWSDAYNLEVYSYKPQPVLTVSPLWLSPGDSVTLNCEVLHPSAGWSFYWFEAVPEQSERIYRRRHLPGSTSGTEQDSYIVHGQTHTSGYFCRAGRGDPVFYTQYSEPQFVWSGDVHPAGSLTVSPDRVQHFTFDSVSLNCEGNSSEWRVKRFTETCLVSNCDGWGTMTGSTCNIHSLQYSDAVYWCESGSGEFSNAANITVHMSRSESSPALVLLLSGVLNGALLIILLLLMYCFIKSKDPCSDRPAQSQSTNQDEPVNRMNSQDEPQEHIYTSPLQGDVSFYESIGSCKDTGNDGQAKECGEATFHSIQLKGLDERSEREDPVKNSNYYNVNPHLTTGTLTQVLHLLSLKLHFYFKSIITFDDYTRVGMLILTSNQ
ncbi:uncharacterized protein LOC119481359 [Sebastes umbrosus]|uniref:uncharacterized protein LOC119481359 n=1 Tax=Sebastes umbrosus TaxID=72105 RepID=UPI00189DF1B3|nr:uncharacterized protein LOC119481359 [Sebastes umbrosus]XP_037614127.1 uncharacterized protein LOC119481359 [Sebastes umbrosus]